MSNQDRLALAHWRRLVEATKTTFNCSRDEADSRLSFEYPVAHKRFLAAYQRQLVRVTNLADDLEKSYARR